MSNTCLLVLKVFKNLRGRDGLSVHLVEISPEFSRIQAEKLCETGSIESCIQPASRTQSENKVGGRQYQVDKSSDSRLLFLSLNWISFCIVVHEFLFYTFPEKQHHLVL